MKKSPALSKRLKCCELLNCITEVRQCVAFFTFLDLINDSSTVPVVETYAGSPRFAAPISMCEIPNSLHDTKEPTIAQLLQEKALYSFSEWPKVLCCHLYLKCI